MANSTEIIQDHQPESWYQRYKVKLAVGAGAISLAAPLAFNQFNEMVDAAKESAHWVAPGMTITFIAYTAGFAIQATAAGMKIKNPFKLREDPSMLSEAKGTPAMRTGFVMNAAGAYGLAGIETAAIMHLPPSSWGMLAYPIADMALTTVRLGGSWSLMEKSEKSNKSSEFVDNSNV